MIQKLIDELDYLKTTRRAEVKEMLKEARAFGDLSENSEYDEARDAQAKNEHRILELEERLKHVVVIDEDAANSNKVTLGKTVTVKNGSVWDYLESVIYGLIYGEQ